MKLLKFEKERPLCFLQEKDSHIYGLDFFLVQF